MIGNNPESKNPEKGAISATKLPMFAWTHPYHLAYVQHHICLLSYLTNRTESRNHNSFHWSVDQGFIITKWSFDQTPDNMDEWERMTSSKDWIQLRQILLLVFAGPDWLLTRFGLLTLIGVLTRPGSNTLVERPAAAALVVVIRFYDWVGLGEV